MTSGLELWLMDATRGLSHDSTSQVWTEIQEHYESAREAAVSSGATPAEAEHVALTALGSARAANCQYRRVLLTSAEARVLQQGNWEARVVCSSPVVRSLLFVVPVIALLAALILFRAGASDLARMLLIGGVGVGFVFTLPRLPIYTPMRSRIARYGKWVVLAAMPTLAFWPDTLKFSWLLVATLWPVFWIEWTRTSIRRKLPVARWPKQLYL